MKRPIIFTILVLVLTWGLLLITGLTGLLNGTLTAVIFSLCMFLPAITSILTRLITKQGFSDLWLRPNFRGNVKQYLLAWFIPVVFMVLGAVVFFLIFPKQFDPTMTSFSSTLKAQGMGELNGAVGLLVVTQIASAILLAPFINFLFALGEELGWRGYLLPELCKRFSNGKAILISTVIWGIWHAPMIALGHNYGVGYVGAPWLGVGAMIVFCMATGALFSYVSLKTKSALPAALGHGSLNAVVGLPILFANQSDYNPFLGPTALGLIGGWALLVVGIFFFWKSTKLPHPTIE